MLVSAIALSLALGLLLVALRSIGAARRRRTVSRHPAPTFLFADLVGYTAMTEQLGDEAAASVAREFDRAISTLTREHGALRVKSLGDGAMIYAPDAAQALALAARTVAEVGSRPDLLPVRVGAHTGPAIRVGGDWFGASVNLAARLAQKAQPNEALVSHATRLAAGDAHGGRLTAFGEVRLAGMSRPVCAWRMSSRTGANATAEVTPTLLPQTHD